MADTLTDFNRYVFVYGTLRRGQQRDINLLQPAPTFVGYSKISGVLYHLGNYPGVRLGGSQWVYGEVYKISPVLERLLDEIEEVWPQQTGEYSRQEVCVTCTGVPVESRSRPDQTCLVYEVAKTRTEGMRVIASGDWLKRSC
jgi:gamma-glutamylcyclotransferase (GGCT)/AIG2-like uncharacterized protein YtfP